MPLRSWLLLLAAAAVFWVGVIQIPRLLETVLGHVIGSAFLMVVISVLVGAAVVAARPRR